MDLLLYSSSRKKFSMVLRRIFKNKIGHLVRESFSSFDCKDLTCVSNNLLVLSKLKSDFSNETFQVNFICIAENLVKTKMEEISILGDAQKSKRSFF